MKFGPVSVFELHWKWRNSKICKMHTSQRTTTRTNKGLNKHNRRLTHFSILCWNQLSYDSDVVLLYDCVTFSLFLWALKLRCQIFVLKTMRWCTRSNWLTLSQVKYFGRRQCTGRHTIAGFAPFTVCLSIIHRSRNPKTNIWKWKRRNGRWHTSSATLTMAMAMAIASQQLKFG